MGQDMGAFQMNAQYPTNNMFGGGPMFGSPQASSNQQGVPMQQNQVHPPKPSSTPESIPVGLMATMLKQIAQRNRSWQTAFFPYKPLDPSMTPQVMPNLHPLNERMRNTLENYFEDEERLERRNRADSRSSSSSRSRSSRS